MVLGSLCLLVLIPCLFLALRQPPGAILPFMLLTGFGWSFFFVYYVTVYPTIQDVVEPELRERRWQSTSSRCTFWGGIWHDRAWVSE
jgi:hypothetical protein